MSDKKKGFQPPTTGASSTSGASGGTTPPSSGTPTGTPPASASTSSRAAARRSGQGAVKVSPQPTNPLEKYRFPIIIGVVVVGLLALGAVFLQSATAAPYTCTTLMTPGPVDPIPTPRPAVGAPVASTAPATSEAPATSAAPATPAPSVAPGASATPAPTPEPQPTQRLGFVAQDLGRGHVSESTNVTYAYCPPTSGQHFSSNEAPLKRNFYSPTDILRPGNWVHNLEHGYVVILYKGEPDADTQAAIQQVMDEAPGTTFTTEQCALPNKVIAVRFDDMSTPYAVLSWDRALLLDTFDAEQVSTFAQQWQESPVWPEPGVC